MEATVTTPADPGNARDTLRIAERADD